jgi:hypothetical protein
MEGWQAGSTGSSTPQPIAQAVERTRQLIQRRSVDACIVSRSTGTMGHQGAAFVT